MKETTKRKYEIIEISVSTGPSPTFFFIFAWIGWLVVDYSTIVFIKSLYTTTISDKIEILLLTKYLVICSAIKNLHPCVVSNYYSNGFVRRKPT